MTLPNIVPNEIQETVQLYQQWFNGSRLRRDLFRKYANDKMYTMLEIQREYRRYRNENASIIDDKIVEGDVSTEGYIKSAFRFVQLIQVKYMDTFDLLENTTLRGCKSKCSTIDMCQVKTTMTKCKLHYMLKLKDLMPQISMDIYKDGTFHEVLLATKLYEIHTRFMRIQFVVDALEQIQNLGCGLVVTVP